MRRQAFIVVVLALAGLLILASTSSAKPKPKPQVSPEAAACKPEVIPVPSTFRGLVPTALAAVPGGILIVGRPDDSAGARHIKAAKGTAALAGRLDYRSKKWQLLFAPAPGAVGETWLEAADSTPNGVFVAGRYAPVRAHRTLVERLDVRRGKWTVVPSPTPGMGASFTHLLAFSDNDVWFGGTYIANEEDDRLGLSNNDPFFAFRGDTSFLAHWDGRQISIIPSPLGKGIFITVFEKGVGGIILVGGGRLRTGAGGDFVEPFLFRGNLQGWTEFSVPVPPVSETENPLVHTFLTGAAETEYGLLVSGAQEDTEGYRSDTAFRNFVVRLSPDGRWSNLDLRGLVGVGYGAEITSSGQAAILSVGVRLFPSPNWVTKAFYGNGSSWKRILFPEGAFGAGGLTTIRKEVWFTDGQEGRDVGVRLCLP